MKHYGTYNPETIRSVFRCLLPTLVLPLCCAGGGLADAVYTFESRDPTDTTHSRYRLTAIREWLPPIHPTLINRPDRLPVMRPDGTLDLEAEATQRRREWAHMSALDGESVWEEDDSADGV